MIQLSKHSLTPDPARYGPKNLEKKLTVVCAEGQVVVSQGGETSIYTGGFAECLGVVIAPDGPPGGLVAHVKQMGKKPEFDQERYMTSWMRKLLEFALNRWQCGSVHVALLKGEKTGVAWDLGLRGNNAVASFLDLRKPSHGTQPPEGRTVVAECGDFRFDPAKKKIYAPGGRADTDRNMYATENNGVGHTPLTIPEAQKSMPVLVFL